MATETTTPASTPAKQPRKRRPRVVLPPIEERDEAYYLRRSGLTEWQEGFIFDPDGPHATMRTVTEVFEKSPAYNRVVWFIWGEEIEALQAMAAADE
jgi:hypothetical protein